MVYQTFPVCLLLQLVLYGNWPHLERFPNVLLSNTLVGAVLKEIVSELAIPALTVSVMKVPVFITPVDKCLEDLLKVLFSQVGLAMQHAQPKTMSVCQA